MKDLKPPTVVEHDEHEFTARKTAGIWWSAFAMLAFLWGSTWYLGTPLDWLSLGMGALTSGIALSWCYDVTDGKVPKSWRAPRS